MTAATPVPCPTCDSALVRSEGAPPHDIDIVATTAALNERVAAGRMREVAGDVPVVDMIDLFAADSKYTIVSYLECVDCGRLLRWGLHIRAAPLFEHVDHWRLARHRWDEVPERARWIGAASSTKPDVGETPTPELTVVAHRSAGWFLLRREVDLYLAPQGRGTAFRTELLFRLDASEKAAYECDGASYLSGLATEFLDDDLWPKAGPFVRRNLYRGRHGPWYRRQVSGAVAAWRKERLREERT